MNDNNITDISKRIAQHVYARPFLKITISGPINKHNETFKIVITPLQQNVRLFYQFSMFYDTKVRHENVEDIAGVIDKMTSLLHEGYKQWDMQFPELSVKLLINKKGTYKIITRANHLPGQPPGTHNKPRRYILEDGEPVPWLVALGVMNKDGKVLHDKQKKFRQINRFLELIDDVAPLLPENPVIVDFGCGKAALSFALYHFLQQKGKTPTIIGLDLKEDVVAQCNDLSSQVGFSRLCFQVGDIKDFDNTPFGHVDMVISLHACDTATDYAIFNAIKWETDVIMCVPCCQHELFPYVKNELLTPLLKHGILKERFSALLTDAMRAALLEARGYKCQVMEFIDMEHTPKNVMIRATKAKFALSRNEAMRQVEELQKAYHAPHTLIRLFNDLPV